MAASPIRNANKRPGAMRLRVATVASVIGGIASAAPSAALLYNTVGQWLINLYGYGAKMDALKETYAQWGLAGDPRQGRDAHPL